MATLFAHEWGTQGDVALVFWHALGDGQSGAEFADVGSVLAGAAFHVVALDGPGFGATPILPADRYALASLAELAHEVIDEHDLDRPVLAGHSWGGAVALAYAAAHPDDVRAVVLLDSGHIDYVDLDDVNPASFPETAQGRAMHGLLERVSPYWDVVAEREIPTLLFLATVPPHGDQNRAHIARFEAAVPHAEVRWLDGATHGIVADVGAPLGDEIAAWLVDQGL